MGRRDRVLTAVVLALGLGLSLVGARLAVAGIANTKHNLSVSGTGSYKATSEQQLCVFCHTPHNATPDVPLWNHALSSATYTPYSSNTLKAAAPGQPTGTTKLCLSCHDGTVALGSVHNMPIGLTDDSIVAGLEAFLTGAANLGTDLRNDHPVSFTYDSALAAANPELIDPATLTGKIKPDSTGQLQCSSCHDPHSETYPKFLHTGYQDGTGHGSPLCLTCHNKRYWGSLEWVASQGHREGTAVWNGVGTNPWHIAGQNLANDPVNSTNKANGCESCHQPHNAATLGNRMLKQDGEAGVCLVCHNGNVASGPKNIDYALNRLYVHPVKTYSGRHNPKRMADGRIREDAADLGLANRHAECEDCHNPHAVSPGTSPNVGSGTPTTNLASKVLKGSWGVTPSWPGAWQDVTSYTVTNDVTYQYELCLKCHSYYAFGLTPPADPYGLIVGGINTDQAKEFNPNNASYHPIVAPGKNDFIGQGGYSYASALINGMTPTSVMNCADCHSDSQNPETLKGPHGADYWPIVWGPYDVTTGMAGTDNHLCFKCHSRTVYGTGSTTAGTENETGFSGRSGMQRKNLHNRHIQLRDAPCYVCHAAVPHGWKRRALLVFGTGTPDEAPYNAHSRHLFNGSTIYGLNSGINLDAINSGNWDKSYCHSASDPGTTGVTGVGSCG